MTKHYESSRDQGPMTWIHGQPIYAAHFIVLVFVASMLVTTVLMAADAGSVLNGLPFTSEAVLQGEVWRVFTYGLLNPPSIWFAIDMVMIVWFGRELEKFFGRRSFLRFYGCLYLLSPLLFTALGAWQPMVLAGETGAFAIFIAFAVLYPNAVLFFNLLAWWVAAILVGLYTLMALSSRDVTALISLWATSGFAFAYVRHAQGRLRLPRFTGFARRPKLRVVRDSELTSQDATRAELDALLDKIAVAGMASLTPQEREKLENARADMLKRNPRRTL